MDLVGPRQGQRTVILEQRGWLRPPAVPAFDDYTVAYRHEGPHAGIDARMWFINGIGTQQRCGKTHEAAGESCIAEFWC